MQQLAANGAESILTVNGGSSSIKFAVFGNSDLPIRRLWGQIERIGREATQLIAHRDDTPNPDRQMLGQCDMPQAVVHLLNYLNSHSAGASIVGVGHRVVHGGPNLMAHLPITAEVVSELTRIQSLDLAHLPDEIRLIDAMRNAFPQVMHVACFDTVFYRDLPTIAKLLPIPRRFYELGIRKYGFHGLSYTFLLRKLIELQGAERANGKVVFAHLGSGASMTAVVQGKPFDTTMSLTPNAGLMMATRPGDLDPSVVVHLLRSEHMTLEEMDDLLAHECGLLGVSETSADLRDLMSRRTADSRAAEAIDLFCYQARKQLGALIAAMGGIDTLVFSGGIGEHSSSVRQAICGGLSWFGVELDAAANDAGHGVISSSESRVEARVIPTDEESVMATCVRDLARANKSLP